MKETSTTENQDGAQAPETGKLSLLRQKLNQKAKRLIPAKYEQATTSGLEREVKEQSNAFDLELAD